MAQNQLGIYKAEYFQYFDKTISKIVWLGLGNIVYLLSSNADREKIQTQNQTIPERLFFK